MSEINDQNYTEETFVLDDTPQDSSTEKVPEDTSTPETPETPEPEKPAPQDNWEVRARYQQSEADKFKNIAQQQYEQIQKLLSNQKPIEKKEPPKRPQTDDPNDLLNYNIQMSEYLAGQVNQLSEARAQESERQRQYEQQVAARQQSIMKLTEVTRNPQKSQKIFEFFADTQNFNDPATYQVMYDALMAYRTGKPPESPKKPPPPPVGGDNLQTKKTPDDAFNEQLGQKKTYRL